MVVHGIGVCIARLDQGVVQDLLFTDADMQGHRLSEIRCVPRWVLFQDASQVFVFLQGGGILVQASAEDVAEHAQETHRVRVCGVQSRLAGLGAGSFHCVGGCQVQCPHQGPELGREEVVLGVAVDVKAVVEDVVFGEIFELSRCVSACSRQSR